MPDFEQMYFHLFGAICDAIDSIDAMNFAEAKQILIKATEDAEEQYMNADESE